MYIYIYHKWLTTLSQYSVTPQGFEFMMGPSVDDSRLFVPFF